MYPSYISKNIDELFDQAPPDIQELLLGEEIKSVTATIGKTYKLPMNSYIPLSNVISFVLIGALQPKDVVTAIKDILKLSDEDAFKLAEDLDKSILEKARISILGKGANSEIKTLVFEGERSPDELRKEIMDTTKRTPDPVPQTTAPQKKQTVLTPGSRSQLLEQLQILEAIPKDEEVETRLNLIKEQITKIDANKDNTLDTKVPLQNFMFGEEGKEVVEAKAKSATYSTAPTKYNIDPYREVAEGS